MTNKILSYTRLLFLFLSLSLTALDPSVPLDRYTMRGWTGADGLPQSTPLQIVQTRDGYLWLGTWGGLARFDGHRFRTFTSADTPEIPNNTIHGLWEDNDGVLWGGTEKGFFRYHQGEFEAIGAAEGIVGKRTYQFIPNGKKSLWILTDEGYTLIRNGSVVTERINRRDYPGIEFTGVIQSMKKKGSCLIRATRGLYQLEQGRLRPFTKSNGLDRSDIRCLYQAPNGAVWVGAKNGLHVLQNGKWRFFDSRAHPFLKEIDNMFQTDSGILWISCFDRGLYFLKNDQFHPALFTKGNRRNIVRFYLDRQNTLWGISEASGLIRIQGERVELLDSSKGLLSDYIWSLLEDRQGNLWVGTHRGLVRLSDPKFRSFTIRDGLISNLTRSCFQESGGAVWIGTDLGRDRLFQGRIDHIPNNSAYGHLQFPDGSILLPDAQNRILSYHQGKIKFFFDPRLLRNYPTTYFLDSASVLWIGTNDGLISLSGGEAEMFKQANGRPIGIVRQILEPVKGELWVAGECGLLRFQDGRFSPVHPDSEFRKMDVRIVYRDSRGTFWIGTDFCGLYRLKNGRLTLFTKKTGLFDDHVSAILEDGRGNLWIGCNRGIYRVSLAELNAFAEKKTERIHCVNFGRSDGMPDEECNGGFYPSAWKCTDGSMWFPTQQGMAVINPETIDFNKKPPEVLIESIQLDGRSYDTRFPERMGPGCRQMEFRYTAFDYDAPERIRFRYRLEGFQKEWIDAGDRRNAYFTNIPPGRYRFRVVACNSEGIWNETGATVTFRLLPRFFQTTWFRMIAGFLFLTGVFLAFQWRVRNLKKRSLLLEGTVAARTVELSDLNQLLSKKNRTMRESIEYARQIQRALFPKESGPGTYGIEYFLLSIPKDSVSGDFSWIYRNKDLTFAAVADCTGHGVPAAMLSVAGYMLLNQIVMQERCHDPLIILETLDNRFRRLFQSDSTDECFYDGMEIALIRIDPSGPELLFTGAGRPLFLSGPEGITEIKGSDAGVGMKGTHSGFQCHRLPITGEGMIYLCSDGIPGQLNPSGRKFGTKRFRAFLEKICRLEINEQRRKLAMSIRAHQAEAEQTDDMTLLGIRIPAKLPAGHDL